MAEPVPIEKLQPCLLDRLTDDDPGSREESRTQRLVSNQKYRRGVLRDLDWLFNTQAFMDLEGLQSFRLRDYPYAYKSVINYGVRQMFGMTAPNLARLREELSETISIFEPRITSRSLEIKADVDRNLLSFDIQGELWANPLPEHLHVKTTLDLETGQCLLGDSPHG